MSRAYSLLFLIGFLVLFATSSLARTLQEEDVAFLDSDISESNEGVDEDIWDIDSLKHHHHHHHHHGGHGSHAHPPKQHHHHHAPPPHSHGVPHRHAPPPHHHAPPPEESF